MRGRSFRISFSIRSTAKSISKAQDNIKQLKNTISSLRYRLEQKDTQRIGELQKVEVLKLKNL